MSRAFVIGTANYTAGILTGPGKGLRFEAAHSAMLSLQDRVFRSPEAAQRAVERIVTKKLSSSTSEKQVFCRQVV
jgi:hypothetical protein